MTVSIFLADDHQVVRQGLRSLLEAQPNFKVVGEADDGLDAVNQVERLAPDVLLLDLMLPGLNGLEVARQCQQRAPKTRIVILSMHSDESYVLQALRNGAAGYVLKQSSATTVIQAVNEVHQGRRFLSPSLSDRAVEAYMQKVEPTTFDLYETLTAREREVLQLAAEGYSNAEIAERLFISCRTVETHRANMMRKLDLKSQTDLIRYALRKGILPLEG
jgi:DNA-binding NarL/FixJ family response regulator